MLSILKPLKGDEDRLEENLLAPMADAKTWAKRVAAWRASGETAASFSSREGYAPSTLRWWASPPAQL